MLPRAIAAAVALLLAAMPAAATLPVLKSGAPLLVRVAGPTEPAGSLDGLTPEQKMQRRYPQPVKVRDLIGLRVLDFDDRTLGRITRVVRTPEGRIQLIVSAGGFLGFGQRLIAVPIEVVAIAGRQIAALDMTRAEFETAPTWTEAQGQPFAAADTIRIALYRR